MIIDEPMTTNLGLETLLQGIMESKECSQYSALKNDCHPL